MVLGDKSSAGVIHHAHHQHNPGTVYYHNTQPVVRQHQYQHQQQESRDLIAYGLLQLSAIHSQQAVMHQDAAQIAARCQQQVVCSQLSQLSHNVYV